MILQLDVSLFSFQTMLPASAMVRVTEHCQSPTPSPSVQAAVPCVGRWVRCPSPIRPQPLRSKSYPSLSPSFQFTVLFQNSYSFPQNSPRFHPNLPPPPHPPTPYAHATCMYMTWKQIPRPQCSDQSILPRHSILSCYNSKYLQMKSVLVCLLKVKIGIKKKKIKKKLPFYNYTHASIPVGNKILSQIYFCMYSTFFHLFFYRYWMFFTIFL